MEEFTGTRLRELRMAANLSQKEAATFLQITISALSQYENGKRIPKRDVVLKIAELYHTTIDYIYGYEAKETEMDAGTKTLLRLCKKLEEPYKDIAIANLTILDEIQRDWRPS